jgi:putative flippase GtrA
MELIRYLVNGILATAIHFCVLSFNINVLQMPYMAVANLVAAIFGVTASFIGSRFYVFKGHQESIKVHFLKFTSLYLVIALLHGLVLLIWSDWFKFDYRLGFLIATALQINISYFGNKKWVFKQ